jgi:hypothetical protein
MPADSQGVTRPKEPTTTMPTLTDDTTEAMAVLEAQPWYRQAVARGLTGPPLDAEGQPIVSGCGTCSGRGTVPDARNPRRRITCLPCKGKGKR